MDLNALSAKIIKAEMLGDMDRVKELKIQLEEVKNSQQCDFRQHHPSTQHNRSNYNHNERSQRVSQDVSGLNALNAKILKAEMRGDQEQVAKLKRQLDELRDNQSADSQSMSQSEYVEEHFQEKRPREPLAKNPKCVQIAKKISENSLSLKQMFVKAKRGEAEDEAKLFIATSSKLLNADDEYEESTRKKKRKTEKEEFEVIKEDDDDQECDWCISKVKKNLVSIGKTVYLCLPSHQPFVPGQCYIRSINHIRSTTMADENCLKEILNLRSRLCQLFDSQHLACIFIEIFFKRGHRQHFQVECIPIKKKYFSDAKMYFRKGIMECEGEWSMNKKLVEMKDKCISKGIPKGLSYFWVSFGPTNDSYGHVIEDEKYFPKSFGHEIIAGLLDLDRCAYTKPKTESFDQQYDRLSKFKSLWKNYDTTDEEKITRETE